MGGESVARPSSRAKKAPATPTAPTANAKKKPTADATKRKGGKGDELENERIDCTTPENPSAEATGLSGEVIAPAETVVIDQDLADANRADFVLRDLTAEHIVQLEAINTPTREAICAFVTSTFSLHDAEVDLLKSILKDYYTNIIMFAKEKKWNGPQTAAFFSIMKAVLERSAAKDLSVDQSLALLRTYITKHCIGKDGILPLYSALQTRQIVDFSVEWLYQHYELYKYCFTVPQETHIYSIELPQIETPVNPPALGLALSEEKFKQKIETEKIRKEVNCPLHKLLRFLTNHTFNRTNTFLYVLLSPEKDWGITGPTDSEANMPL
eukprot:TRINITY_DN4564_c0_g1_i4.p1 TRINITY_DN4564_c0_g1~~TRINITY_DN4564_c0_g1_i4.p1  ORF type:complete len:326 (-),score=74.63 TRINITY_DN4564_c0_g1_i4:676-1653(-)